MASTNTFREAVESIKATVKKSQLVKNGSLDHDHEWLRALYASYTTRFISDNNRIWVTGSIMIPLALSGFALLPTIEKPTIKLLLPIALASSVVLLAWNLIADNHRAFQEKSFAWLTAIEEILDIDKPVAVKVQKGFLMGFASFKGAVRATRWFLFFAVVIVWVLMLLYWPEIEATC